MSLTSRLTVFLAVAAVWGGFTDLRAGEVGGFALRLLLAAGAAVLWHRLARRADCPPCSARARAAGKEPHARG